MSPPVLIAARQDRGQAWANVLKRSHHSALLAVLDLDASGVEGIDEALDARPDAAVAVWAAGPREATSLAERLVEHPGPALLHPAPARPPAGQGVQLTHAWLSLSGIGALERLFASRSVETVRLSVKGLPEGPADGLADALYHAATLVLRLGRDVRVDRAVLTTEQELTLTLVVDGVPWRVDVGARGQALSLTVRTAEGDYQWGADAVSESLRRPRAEPRIIPAVPWAERCLAQLARPIKGAELADARAARGLVDVVEQSLERRLPPSRIPPVDPDRALAGLGLLGVLPDAAPMAPRRPPSAALPLEATGYILGLRPATYLTVEPQDADRVRAMLPGTVERRDRQLHVGAGDRFDDDRARGEPRVELYAARDAEVARRLAELQLLDPSEHLSEIGALLGYPACCVQAFANQADRADNSYNRYAIAARTSVGPGPWPAWLDDTSLKVLPHYTCTYRCERSVAQAEALLEALADEDPALRAAITGYLGGPVLYFDHDHQLRFDGECLDAMSIRYRAVSLPSSPSESFAHLAAAIALGDRLVLGEGAMGVYRGDDRVVSLERTDPGLGIILPFARRSGGRTRGA